MKHTTQSIIKYTVWAFIFAATSYVYATGTFTEPVGGPEDGNTDAPINVGPVSQTKTGNFGAASFCDETGANCMSASTIVNTSATSQTKSGPLETTGFTSLSYGHIGTNLSVGSPVVNPAPLGLVGLFGGKVGATEYCNQTGGNCVNPDGQKLVYITDRNHVYTTTSSETGVNRGGLTTYLGLTKIGNISLTSLKSFSPEFAAETRTIKGIIVSYSGAVTSGNFDSANMWYSFDIKGNATAGDSYPSHQSQHIYYDYSANVGTAPLYGSPLILVDGDSDSTFEFWWNLFRTTVANINISLNFQVTLSVIGYITE
jgi:hypothetical protein